MPALALREFVIPIHSVVRPVTERLVGRMTATTKEERLSVPRLYGVPVVIDEGHWALDLVGARLGDGNSDF